MTLSWLQIFRMGLVQMCLGAVVVLTTSTLNRLMVVELALPAVLPGLLVALHYGIQITRPNWGYLSDTSGHRTRWIIGGMAVLASGGYLAALAVVIMESQFGLGLGLSILAYALIGLGVGASGTSLLALLATATAPRRRAAAATITWLMMIGGIAVTATTVGAFLDPYTPALLLEIVGVVALGAVVLTALAIHGIEARVGAQPARADAPLRFREGLAEIWAEREARLFTIFVFLSMTAYFMQELILEPYAGLVFHFTPGQSTQLSGAQNGGVFLGMLTVGVAATGLRLGSIRHWVVGGCLGSASALAAIALLGASGAAAAFVPIVVVLGFFNGMFAVGAIGAMMALAGQGREAREGTRMGLWGAAQAMAAGFGGLMGAASVDVMRLLSDTDATAFGTVFFFEAGLFVLSALMALRVIDHGRDRGATLVPGE
ncbi:Bacteriochlorophyll synthase 44.5 kDa chain [Roseovarius sp. EC-HK134]|jgi:BCD family chlorophyll transporter-like MFS transporter|uniref:BCD family MFS transporter n=1 Tax=Roseovarius TaxID=74030 RepID=UPI000155744C|nr:MULTISPECIES: BCD family MFS transporter [Roseovarius]AWZ22451.1 Bacteriochlorophyll synthase 44.5 kDa chain [Roseovarius sp. AK1035]EDM32180.1 putative light-harvesting 1 (B870) complex assembly protein PucC [Roseovarius sp. TM1035]MBW4972696.1 BCD family MFS transporter [Roseovarius mucosus]VVT32914.1 Bacteriochlorophyll synthase 44.5 kDa chain [Roseovarius sp. EC-HK134]VVT32999.1 Bacteriochlorophyll synthase 44.5 kDa chain [Roseovarius sp. EC-SD190]